MDGDRTPARRVARLTLGRFVAVLLLVGVAALVWQGFSTHKAALAQAREQKLTLLEDAMRQDDPVAYRQVLEVGATLSPPSKRADAMRAYAATVLAIEHQQANVRPLSESLLQRAPSLQDELLLGAGEGFWSAARLLAVYGTGDLNAGERVAEAVMARPEQLVLAKLEALRLRVAAKCDAARVHVAAELLASRVSQEVRALSYLGVWALSENNTALAEQYFHRALAVNPSHPTSLLGLRYVRLTARTVDPQAIWQGHRTAEEVLRAQADALTPPVHAMALLVRALAFEHEGNAPRAQADRSQALQLDPSHLLHDAINDAPARP